MCLDRHCGRNCQRDTALVLRQVMSLLRCNWQDQVFGPIACNQEVLLELTERNPTNVTSPVSAGRLRPRWMTKITLSSRAGTTYLLSSRDLDRKKIKLTVVTGTGERLPFSES